MPIYEYVCRTCSGRFDRLRPIADRLSPPTCPTCGTTTTSLVMSATAKVTAGAEGPAFDACGNGSCCGGACLN